MWFCIVLPIFAGFLVPADLEARLESFWNNLVRGDFVAASEVIQPEAREWFLSEWLLGVSTWESEGIKTRSEDQAVVAIRAVLEDPRMQVPIKVEQKWVRKGEHWFIQMPRDPSSKTVNRALFGSPGEQAVPIGTVRVVPPRLVLHYLNPLQRGTFAVQNGLAIPVEIGSCEFDRGRFRLAPESLLVEAGQSGDLIVEFIGKEEEKGLVDHIDCVLSRGDERRRLKLPVLFNHVSREARAFFGLDDEAVSRLNRRDPPAPLLHPPK